MTASAEPKDALALEMFGFTHHHCHSNVLGRNKSSWVTFRKVLVKGPFEEEFVTVRLQMNGRIHIIPLLEITGHANAWRPGDYSDVNPILRI